MPVPTAPSGLAVAATGLRADLTWTDNASDETYYEVSRRSGSDPYIAIKYLPPSTVRWFDYSVRPSTSYDYQVKAGNASGLSTASNTGSVSIPTAPTATGSLSVPATAFVDEVFIVDARGSTNISPRPQADGSPSLTIDVDDGTGFKSYIPAFGYAYRTPGVKTLRLNAKNASGVAITEVTASITISDHAVPTGANSVPLFDLGDAANNATQLQTAITNAVSSGVRRDIVLSGSWTTPITGPIFLSARTAGSPYIRIYWDGMTVPHDKRAVPADFANAPTITQPHGLSAYPALGCPLTASDPPSNHYIIDGIKLTRANPAQEDPMPQYLLLFGLDAGTGNQDTFARQVNHFIVRHCWIDGGTVDSQYIKDGIRNYGNYVSVFDSYAAEFKQNSGADPSAMGCSGGVGPSYWYNNYLVADGENFSVNVTNPTRTGTISSPTINGMTLSTVSDLAVDDNIAVPVGGEYGAAFSAIVASINVGTGAITFKEPLIKAPDNSGTASWQPVHSFLTFRRNYCYKPLSWKSGNPGFTEQLNVKNLWETKNAKYWIVDGNVLANCWNVGQPFALVVGSATADNTPSGQVIREFQWTNNLEQNAMTGPNILGSANAGQGQQNTGFHFYNNLFRAGGGWFQETTNDGFHLGSGNAYSGSPVIATQVERFFWVHNTNDEGVPTVANAFSSLGGDGITTCTAILGTGALDSMFYNSLFQDCGYGFFTSFCGTLDQRVAISTYLAPGDATTFDQNLVVNPNGHTYPSSGLTQTADWTADVFDNWTTGDLTLKAGNPGKGTALDGTDIGVNMVTLNAATAGAVSGVWTEDEGGGGGGGVIVRANLGMTVI